MRKLLVVALALAIMGSLAVPGRAARPARWRYSSASANAFWTDIDWLSSTRYRRTVWYIGVYQTPESTWSDVYREVARCRVGGEVDYDDSCYGESFLYGDKLLDGDEFRISSGLRAAHLDATYRVRELDSDWDAVGPRFNLVVTTDWTPAGRPGHGGGVSNFKGECYSYHSVYKGRYAAAEAEATAGGEDLGETYDAGLGSSTWLTIERTC